MKKLFYILFFVLLSSFSFAQDFGAVRTKWTYDSYNSIDDYTVFESISDSLILGKMTHNIKITSFSQYGSTNEGNMFVYQQGDTVFEYNQDSNRFHIMMRFNLNYNDTIEFNSYRIQSPYKTYKYRVYSVAQEPVGGLYLKTMKMECLNCPLLGRFTFVNLHERVGFFNYFYLDEIHYSGTFFGQKLRCYSDSLTNQNFWNKPCELIHYTSINENSLNSKIQLSPNPANNFLNINSEELEILNLQIFDIHGKEIIVGNNSITKLNVSSLKNGIYLLKTHTKQGVITKKWVKN